MIVNKKDKNKCGIYCIKNKINNKVYIGKSINIYRRIVEHCYLLNKRDKNENPYLINSWFKYGRSNFEYRVLEYLEPDEKIVSKKELYYIEYYDSTNKNKGYNLRKDSQTKMIVHENTSKKISNNLKLQWAAGIRDDHSKKLSDNWSSNTIRKKNQSELLSKILTKYTYKLYDLDNNFIKSVCYKDLITLGLKNCTASFHKKKSNKIKFKNLFIERIYI